MSTLTRIRDIALFATLAAAALSASASQAQPVVADLGGMQVSATRLMSVADLGAMTVTASRSRAVSVAQLGEMTVVAGRTGDIAVADLGSTTVTAPRLVTIAMNRVSKRPIG